MWYYLTGGQQGGPVPLAELCGLLRERRVGAHDPVWQAGMGDWVPASQRSEFAEAIAAGAAATPAAQAGMLPQPAPGMPYTQAPQMNGMALASMILGLVSFILGTLIFTAIPAVICGHVARRQIRQNPHLQTGDGMALTGLITGYLSILLTLVVVVLLVILFAFFFNEMSSGNWTPSSPSPTGPSGTPPPSLPGGSPFPTPAPVAPVPGPAEALPGTP